MIKGEDSASILAEHHFFCYNKTMPLPQTSDGKSHHPGVVMRPFSLFMTRLGVPVFLFGITFLSIVIGVRLILSPGRFPVRLGAKIVRIADLEAEKSLLQSRKQELLSVQEDMRKRVAGRVLQQVQTLRESFVKLPDALSSIEALRKNFTTESVFIEFSSFSVLDDGSTLRIQGSVRDAYEHSLQSLTAFTDAIRALPYIRSFVEPEYILEPLPGGGTRSPFTLVIQL